MNKIIRTRKDKLMNNLASYFSTEDINVILGALDIYEKDNIDTIEKLKRVRKIELNKINGALKQTINAHGPITKELIGSASKRIHGALLDNIKSNIKLRRRNEWKYTIWIIVLSVVILSLLKAFYYTIF
jgi:hypothetical protein